MKKPLWTHTPPQIHLSPLFPAYYPDTSLRKSRFQQTILTPKRCGLMGCVHSKKAASSVVTTPVFDYSVSRQSHRQLSAIDHISVVSSKTSSGLSYDCEKSGRRDKKNGSFKQRKDRGSSKDRNEVDEFGEDQRGNYILKNKKKIKNRGNESFDSEVGFSNRNVGAELIAAGWPSWLSAAAGEAIHGWVPLRADAYEKLDKIGQGTYSSVFQAREVKTGRMVALKKVRFDNFQPESIRFMAREIKILRSLDHPNIIKLDGIITSWLSCSVYLVFEYMEHDLAGLVSSPDITFTEAQVKCYMKQLLGGLEHCHLRGIMHRDIKASNILVSNDGILKIGDFGLANTLDNKQQLTSRVVTLWYRPPELLMGSTSYGVSVDLWSVGCVFAELLLGKPILKGRTEVEQLHKIFKLCGSPPEYYWKHSKLSNATMFRPQHPYESSLRERCQNFSEPALELLETFLSVEPERRGTASSSLMSQYFSTAPYACDPLKLPKYPPNKEMDAKCREIARRKKAGGRLRDSLAPRKPRRIHKTFHDRNSFGNFALKEEAKDYTQYVRNVNDTRDHTNKRREAKHHERTPAFDTISVVSQGQEGDYSFSGPTPVKGSSGFAWSKTQKEDNFSAVSYDPSISSSQFSALDLSRFNFANGFFELKNEENDRIESHDATTKNVLQEQHNPRDPSHSLNLSEGYHSHDSVAASLLRRNQDFGDHAEKVANSGNLLSESNKIDAQLQRNETQIRRTDIKG